MFPDSKYDFPVILTATKRPSALTDDDVILVGILNFISYSF